MDCTSKKIILIFREALMALYYMTFDEVVNLSYAEIQQILKEGKVGIFYDFEN